MIKSIRKNKYARLIFSILCAVISSLLQTFVIQTFMKSSNLLSSGFTGIAMLINKISNLFNIDISVSFLLLLLNVPVALLCYRSISKRFTLLSILQVGLTSLFLKIFEFSAIFNDMFLETIFGGFLYGVSVLVALKGNISTGGTDFIALYISSKKSKSIWNEVFLFNVVLLCIFGYIFGWLYAGYSILFQFISTKTIATFHQRYTRLTLQITTTKASEIIEQYVKEYRHGISCIESIGGYSRMDMNILYTIVSAYEVDDIVYLLKETDPKVIVNVLKTEKFYGGFYQKPID